jgi:hypothetical protein
MNLSVEELCRDISALSLEQKVATTTKKQAKQNDIDKAADAKATDMEKAVKRAMSATQKRARPVLEQYNCRENQHKFCIPITL